MLDKILDILLSKKGALILTVSLVICLAFSTSCSGGDADLEGEGFSCSAIANCMSPETCGNITGNAAESGCAAVQCGCSFFEGCAENVDTEEVTSSLGCMQAAFCDGCDQAHDCANSMTD